MRDFVLECSCFSGGSVHNVYTEEEESTSSEQQTLENSITMNKMKLLKAKMENMNLNKKVQQIFLSFLLHIFSLNPLSEPPFTCIHLLDSCSKLLINQK